MDATDFKILEILQRDGRISMKRLAEEINMSTPATIERVRRLEDNQSIVGYRAMVRPDRVGRECSAYILISVNQDKRSAFYDFVKGDDRVIEVYELAGRFTAILYVSCRDMEDYLRLIYTLYDLGNPETYQITDVVKSGIYRRIQNTRDLSGSFYSPFKSSKEDTAY